MDASALVSVHASVPSSINPFLQSIKSIAQVALGFQLPRDRLSASGRERSATAAAAAEEALRSAYEPVPALTLSPERADFIRQNIAHRRRGWLPVHRDGSLTDGEESPDHEGYSCFRSSSRRDRAEEFSAARHFLQAGIRWPSSPKRAGGGYHRYFSSLGRSRDNSRRRRRMAERSKNGGGGGGYSWSPPRTGKRTASCGAFSPSSTAGSSSNSSSTSFVPESREEEEDEEEQAGSRFTSSSGGKIPQRRHRRRSLSPLMLPLDPFRSSRTVVRAGTVVSLRDSAAAERSSRRAAFNVRRASKARITAERHAADAAVLGISSPGRGHRGKQQQRQRQRQGRRTRSSSNNGANLGDDRNDAWTTSGVLPDPDEEERRVHAIRRFLPSVASIDRELEAIRRADATMREQQLAQVGV